MNSMLTPFTAVSSRRFIVAVPFTLVRLLFLRILLVAICSVGAPIHAQFDKENWCAPGVPRHEAHPITGKTCPVAGSMGGAKLAIPEHYFHGPITYKGIDIWKPESYRNSPKHPTFDNEIANFAIRIRQTNFKPIETIQDQDDYAKVDKTLKAQPPENRWIYVNFDARRPLNPGANFSSTRQLWLKDEAHWGPYNKKPDTWGLEHYVSVQPPTTTYGSQSEFYYDAKTEGTFIECENSLRWVPAHDLSTFCTLDFIMPEVKALVKVSHIQVKDDLANWRDIEVGIRRVVHSFIVP